MDLQKIGVTAAKIKQFSAKEIYTVEDLLRYWPRRHNDYTELTGPRGDIERAVFIATIRRVRHYASRGKLDTVIASCTVEAEDKTGSEWVSIMWFRQSWRYNDLSCALGQRVLVVGRVNVQHSEKYGDSKTVLMPEVFDLDVKKALRVYPVYSKIPGMSMDYLLDKIDRAIEISPSIEDPVPSYIRQREGLISQNEMIAGLHRPRDMAEVERARERLVFDQLLEFTKANEEKRIMVATSSPYKIKSFSIASAIKKALPYELTTDQRKTINAMLHCVEEGRRINALVQGDVGCGKTITAVLMMAAFVGSGYQTALMAPTQVLALQHYNDLRGYFEPAGIKVVFVGGEKLKKKEQAALEEAISSGEAKVIVGTQALFSENIKYKDLALTVVDEEHRFGVKQRLALARKGAEGVHNITMSATPIPRSLASTLYGDALAMYSIRSMPAGRRPVKTKIYSLDRTIFSLIRREVEAGHQAYVVCPMIDSSEGMGDVLAVEDVYKKYSKALEPKGIRIKALTGRTGKEEREKILTDMKDGNIDVLISTTVIEVGVNIPNATVMVISNAERFGLSQLHQLRGRVGRSSLDSWCILSSNTKSRLSSERLAALCKTNDGFEIAQIDLKLRGAGDLLGTRQSGENKYVSLVLAYPDIYEKAKVVAKELLDRGDGNAK